MFGKDKNQIRKVITVILSFLIIFCGLGLLQPRGQFVVPVTTALGISRSVYSVTDTIRAATAAILNLFFGVLIERFGSKKLLCAGFIAFISGALFFGFAENAVALYAGSLLFGMGTAWCGTAMAGYIINRVCGKNRGVVLGAVMAANGVGGAIASQVFAPFLAGSTATSPFRYRVAYYIMAGIFAFVFLLLIIFFKNPKTPAEFNAQKKQRAFSWEGIEFGRAKKTAYFYFVCACVLITGFSLQGLSSVRAAYMDDVGFSRNFIAGIASVGAIMLTVSKFLNGFIYQKTGLRLTVIFCALCSITGVIMLFFLRNDEVGKIIAYAYVVLLTTALPLETVMLPVYASDLFGEKSFSKVLGIFVAMHQAGSALSSPIMNLCYDNFGSYLPAFVAIGVLMALMLILINISISSANRLRLNIERRSKIVEEKNN